MDAKNVQSVLQVCEWNGRRPAATWVKNLWHGGTRAPPVDEQRHARPSSQRFDANKDGKIDLDEFVDNIMTSPVVLAVGVPLTSAIERAFIEASRVVRSSVGGHPCTAGAECVAQTRPVCCLGR